MPIEKPYIHAGWFIDGKGNAVKKDVLLHIVNGYFTDIEDFNIGSSPPPEQITDLSHCTILPPLIDCHVHLALSGTTSPQARKDQLLFNYNQCSQLIIQHVRDHFAHGVLAIRDGGDRHGHVLRYKNENDNNPLDAVIIKAAGKAWHQHGRYGKMLGHHPKENQTLNTAYANNSDRLDHVKVIHSGPNSLRHFARETSPQFSMDELEKLTILAIQKGERVMAHANGSIPVRQALEAGCHSIEHGYFMGKENIQRMAEKQATWVPTLFAMQACRDNITKEANADPAIAGKTLEHQIKQLAYAGECGVKIALGTDAGSIGVLHGKAVAQELKLFIKAGFSLSKAIRCATFNGAQLLDIEKDFGYLAKGRLANFIVARSTPSQLPERLSDLETIYREGKPKSE